MFSNLQVALIVIGVPLAMILFIMALTRLPKLDKHRKVWYNMSIERDAVIQAEYDKLVAKVAGGRLYGEYVMSPKELVIAAYLIGINEGRNQLTPQERFQQYLEE